MVARVRERQAMETMDGLERDDEFLSSRQSIRPGRFTRDAADPGYASRARFTKEIRGFVYDPALMNVVLFDEELKRRFFRLFGYSGALGFTMNPHVWMRDLPLLDIGHEAYLGDHILLGTNRVSRDQKTLRVGPITIGDRCVFDQRCSIGLGSAIGRDSSFGFSTSISLKCEIGEDVKCEEYVGLGAGCIVGDGAVIQQNSKIGNFVRIEPGASIQPHSVVPKFATVREDGEIVPRRR